MLKDYILYESITYTKKSDGEFIEFDFKNSGEEIGSVWIRPKKKWNQLHISIQEKEQKKGYAVLLIKKIVDILGHVSIPEGRIHNQNIYKVIEKIKKDPKYFFYKTKYNEFVIYLKPEEKEVKKIFESSIANTFNDLYRKKNKWINIKGIEKKILAQNLFDLVQNAYKNIGGHFEINNPDDIMQYEFIKAEDVDKDPEADIMQVYKKTSHGDKFIVSGQDGSSEAKRTLLNSEAKELFKPGYYAEVSDKLAEILLNKFNVPYVKTKEEVEEVLGKKVQWIGNGWYERNVSVTGIHKKILVGRPK